MNVVTTELCAQWWRWEAKTQEKKKHAPYLGRKYRTLSKYWLLLKATSPCTELRGGYWLRPRPIFTWRDNASESWPKPKVNRCVCINILLQKLIVTSVSRDSRVLVSRVLVWNSIRTEKEFDAGYEAFCAPGCKREWTFSNKTSCPTLIEMNARKSVEDSSHLCIPYIQSNLCPDHGHVHYPVPIRQCPEIQKIWDCTYSLRIKHANLRGHSFNI